MIKQLSMPTGRIRTIASLLLGFASATGFAPLGWWPVTLAALAGWMALVFSATDTRQALQLGYAFGAGHFILGLNWIAGSFRYQESMPVWLGWIAVVLLSLYLAVYPAVAAALSWRAGQRRPLAFVLAFGGAWIATEWARATVFTGFAWNPLAVAWLDVLDVPPAIRLVGTYGSSGLMVIAAGIVWMAAGALFAARRTSVRQATRSIALLLALPLLAFAGQLGETEAGSASRPVVRIVQPNIGQQDKYREGYDQVNFAKLEGLTGLAGERPRLILWPEAAIPDYLEEESWARRRVASLLGPKDMLLTGGTALIFDKAERISGARNAVFALTPDAQLIGRYDKAHLVPYGEYLALRWLLEPLGATRLVPGDIDFIPGPGARTLDLSKTGFGRAGVQVCYEIIFSGQVVDKAHRPDFLFNPSNDAWFGSWGPPQHLAQARLRAVEEGLPVVRSTPTGISAVIDSNGTVIRSLPYKQAGFIETVLPRAHAQTLFARAGNALSLGLAVVMGIFGIALGARRR